MLLNISICVIAAAVMIITPFYVKAQRNGACPKSMTLKMIAATGYLSVGILSMITASNYTVFAKIMLCALIASWVGDLFLHMWGKKLYKGLGFMGFLTAHFFFIAAYSHEMSVLVPERGFFNIVDFAPVLLFVIFFVIYAQKSEMKFSAPIKIAIIVYAAVIMTMLTKAAIMSVYLIKANAVYAGISAIFACFGGLCFVMSDFSISILMFNEKQKKNYKLKMFNMVTYFIAELCLASLILTVRG